MVLISVVLKVLVFKNYKQEKKFNSVKYRVPISIFSAV